MKIKHASPINREIEHIGRQMLACIYEAVLGAGLIDSDGKTEEQVMTQVRQIAYRWVAQRPMMWSMDFKSDLLSSARGFKRKRKNHEAILYYATWFEHWINGVLIRKLRTLDEHETCQMIRDVSLRGKFTWLLALIHKKRLVPRHIKAIFQICELRNEFVHHKYKMFDVDNDDKSKKYDEACRTVEKTVGYLQKFEECHLFKGSARGLLRRLRNTKYESEK